MNTHKHYVLDTNVLLEDPSVLFKLRNGSQNRIYIPFHVIMELDRLKKKRGLGPVITQIVRNLSEFPDYYQVLTTESTISSHSNLIDRHILDEIQNSGLDNPILLTNDRIFQLHAGLRGIKSQVYEDGGSSKPAAEQHTGFASNPEEIVPNCFMWGDQGKPVFYGAGSEKIIDYQHKIWNVTPRNVYQNLALELMVNPDIHIVSLQSEAGYGKSFLALAVALYLSRQKKLHGKIYLIKPMIEIGKKLGYLPGKVTEKIAPYTGYISDLMLKLHRLRAANRLFINTNEYPVQFDSAYFEILPMAYIRGMTLENCVVIIDETQNLSRSECRAILSRMGDGVKCICLGDIHQIDHPGLSAENNGLNWIVKKFKGSRIYAHLVLKGDKSRGPITDLVIKSGL